MPLIYERGTRIGWKAHKYQKNLQMSRTNMRVATIARRYHTGCGLSTVGGGTLTGSWLAKLCIPELGGIFLDLGGIDKKSSV